MFMRRHFPIHSLKRVKYFTHQLKKIYRTRPNPVFGGFIVLTDCRYTLAQSLNALLHVPAHRRVELLTHNHVQIPAVSLVQIVHRRQARRSARHQLERAQRLDLFHNTHRLSRMVVHRPGVALELLAVVQGFNLALDRLIPDLSTGLAQSIAVGVDALLGGLVVLPYLMTFRHPGHAHFKIRRSKTTTDYIHCRLIVDIR